MCWKRSTDRRQLQLLTKIRKSNPFSAEDLVEYKLKAPLERTLETSFLASGKVPADYRILDIGCGRGLAVAHLLSRGFDAYGGEASIDQVELAQQGLENSGHDTDRIVQLNLQDGRYPLHGGTFDFIYSDNVIEHVEDLNAFIDEVARLTTQDGKGFHIFPSIWKPTEVHLRIPFVHWLPKNRTRYYFIRIAMSAGFDPYWVRNEGKEKHEAAEDYYNYIQNNTYYRSPWRIVKSLNEKGFVVDTYMTGKTVMENTILGKYGCPRLLISLATMLSILFHTTILTTKRTC